MRSPCYEIGASGPTDRVYAERHSSRGKTNRGRVTSRTSRTLQHPAPRRTYVSRSRASRWPNRTRLEAENGSSARNLCGSASIKRSRGDEGPPPGTALIPSRSLGGSVAPASLLCALLSSPTPNRSRSSMHLRGFSHPARCLKLARALTTTRARQEFDCGSGIRAPCGEREYRWSPLPSRLARPSGHFLHDQHRRLVGIVVSLPDHSQRPMAERDHIT
jgi:hypothetical protein